MKKLLEKIKGLLQKFKSQNKKIKIAVIVAVLAVFIAIGCGIYYSSSNKYQVLFSNLDEGNEQTVIDYLNKNKIDAKVDSSSNTIMVPQDQVDKLRLALAPNLTTQSQGFELMDSGSSFGMTDEEFKIKNQRMQQGELEKTIKEFPQIQDARVHITEAQNSVFAKDKQPGKAAVYLKFKQGQTINEDQVKSIVALVSGATENIPKENIDVIDDKMNLLTKDINSDENGSSVNSEAISKQQNAEKVYEDKLQKAIISMLEPIVGKDKVKATVNADLDFDSKKKTQTLVDPNKVIVSQENSKETNNSGTGTTSQSPVDNNMSNQITNNTDNSTSSKEDQKTNYDTGKTETQTISAPGEVKRLTASVVVDGNLDAQTQEALENAVGNAIGLDTLRGDKVSVLGMAFDTTAQDQAKAELDVMNAQEAAASRNRMMIIAGILGAIVLAGAIAGGIIFIRKRRAKKEEEEQLLDTLIDDSIIPKEPEGFEPIEFEAKTKKSHLEDEIKKYATEKPDQVVEIIKSWLTENER
ncbi:flagellar basal-body MS-ring/collar protein FliF [uncultured Clostridium sp.]|uniref:flagellar basal-body MS-ring/collar protein FliF n=1 Tax=uncultured Clostridium sp. TaxID=59620 RepID=UPI0028E83D4B|nr:flagellar basal-body MS-ring/collar protein FliF [uncultured Clostridium sp.]